MNAPSSRRAAPGVRCQHGFTLVELAVALAVTAILIVMAMPNFSLILQNSQIRTAAESVQNGLQLARAQAIQRNAQVSFTFTGNDWTVATVQNPTSIQQRSNLSTPNAIIAASQNAVIFNGLGQLTPPATATIAVSSANGTCQAAGGTLRCLNITVLSGGQTRLCDPNLPATSAQSC